MRYYGHIYVMLISADSTPNWLSYNQIRKALFIIIAPKKKWGHYNETTQLFFFNPSFWWPSFDTSQLWVFADWLNWVSPPDVFMCLQIWCFFLLFCFFPYQASARKSTSSTRQVAAWYQKHALVIWTLPRQLPTQTGVLYTALTKFPCVFPTTTFAYFYVFRTGGYEGAW